MKKIKTVSYELVLDESDLIDIINSKTTFNFNRSFDQLNVNHETVLVTGNIITLSFRREEAINVKENV